MPNYTVAVTDAALTGFGLKTSATAFNTGTRVNTNGTPTVMDIQFTGASSVTIPNPYMQNGSLFATLYATNGTTVLSGPVTPSPTTQNSLSNADLPVFTGLTEGTTYWLHLFWTGGGSQILQSDKMIVLTGTGTPTVSLPGTLTRNLYTFATASYDGADAVAHMGLEGGTRIQSIGGNVGLVASQPHAYVNYGMFRFKGNPGKIYLAQYHASAKIHLRRLNANGLDGVGTFIGTYVTDGAGNIAGWDLVFSGLDTSTQYIYEMSFSYTSGGGVIIPWIMTSGGTIDMTVTAASLVRPIIAVGIGDSIIASVNGSNVNSWEGPLAILGQQTNKQVCNFGFPARSLTGIITDQTWLDMPALSSVPQNIIFEGGINDIKDGSNPTPATIDGRIITIMNNFRAVSGFSTVKLWVQSYIPYSGMTWAALDAYNNGATGTKLGVVGAYNAGTAASQSPSPDPNVFYLDLDPLVFAGSAFVTGGSFVGTNYDGDGLHPNGPDAASVPGPGMALIGARYVALLAPAVVGGLFRSSIQRHMRRGTRQLTSN